MRCLNLANVLVNNGFDVGFICRDLGFPVENVFQGRNFELTVLPKSPSSIPFEKDNYKTWLSVSAIQDATDTIKCLESLKSKCEWLIIDHYSIDEKWETIVRPHCQYQLVIDDLANRHHQCDILVDHNYYEKSATRYENWVNKESVLLLGPNYILLQEKYRLLIARAQIRQSVSCILINFGGIDLQNETTKALYATLQCSDDVEIHVVVGVACPHKSDIEALCGQFTQCHYYCQTAELDRLVVQADLAIGSGGMSLWERIALGLPSIVSCIAENQRQILEDVSKTGCIRYLGTADQVSTQDYLGALQDYLNNPEALESMSERCLDWIDGQGCDRVMNEMKKVSQSHVI